LLGSNLDNYIATPFTENNMDLYLIRSSIRNAVTDFLSNHRGTLLDIGCGKMPYKPLVLGHGERYRYVGLDIENHKYQQTATPDLFWDGVTIPLDDNSVDCVIATELFEHLPSPENVMSEICRVLRPNGHLFFTVPFLWPLHDLPYDEYRYTPSSLERHLKNSGFSAVSIKALGGWDACLAQMIGLWARRKPMSKAERAKVSSELFPYYQKLIELDERPEVFSEGQMITGLYGVATKPYSNFCETNLESQHTNGY
jgi:SAM-dependent methyltransferase